MSNSSVPLSQNGVTTTGLGVRAEGGLDVDSPAWTGENERPCETHAVESVLGQGFRSVAHPVQQRYQRRRSLRPSKFCPKACLLLM